MTYETAATRRNPVTALIMQIGDAIAPLIVGKPAGVVVDALASGMMAALAVTYDKQEDRVIILRLYQQAIGRFIEKTDRTGL